MTGLISLPTLRFLSRDIPAGIVVFLVAIPLCLGIALASGAPLMSGLIAGVIGGLVVTLFSGSELSVSGPAAGLVVIVLDAVARIGSFEGFLMAVVIAGFLQIVFGVIKAGTLADYVPDSVIRGMLSGIGVLIFIKQVSHLVGWDHSQSVDEVGIAIEHESVFAELLASMDHILPGALLIGLTSLLILILFELPAIRRRKWSIYIPGPLIAVVTGTLISEILIMIKSPWALSADTVGGNHLVSIPTDVGVGELIIIPDFAAIALPSVWLSAVILAVIASIETLLCLEAVDKMDPYRRISNGSKELKAQGIGNMLSGLVGGLPITSVIVRSSTAVYAGGKSRMTPFVHGIFILTAILILPDLINKIPLACLAAVLIHVGYKLASVKIIKGMYALGVTQFVPFAITIISIVVFDLLTGIIIGVLVSMVFVLLSNRHNAVTVVNEGNQWLVRFNKDMSFVNKSELKEALRDIPDDSSVIINARKALFIERDIIEIVSEFQKGAALRNIQVQLIAMQSKKLFAFKPFNSQGS